MIPKTDPASRQLLKLGRNSAGRDFAVGDVHGSFSALQTGLDSIGFDPAVDRLLCCGDLVDRGPESHLVEAWLDKSWFFSSLGNHDHMASECALDRPGAISNYQDMGGGWLVDLTAVDRIRIGERLRRLPLAIEVGTSGGPVGLVHADFPTDDWKYIERPFSEDDRQICMWSTMRFDRMYKVRVANVRALVHGHLTLPVAHEIANVFFIDTGGWKSGLGHFTFLELESLNFFRGPGPNVPVKSRRNR